MPDPPCEHQALTDRLIHALAQAHGRPEAAERTAWGLPTSENKHAAVLGYTPDKARPEQAGLSHTQEDT